MANMMHIMVIGLLGVVLVGMLSLAVMSPKPAQRAIALSVSLCAIFMIAYTIILIRQKEFEVWNYGRNIRPTSSLLAIVGDDLRAGRYREAASRLDLIRVRWEKVNARLGGYSANDIMHEIRTLHPAEQADPNSSENEAPSDVHGPSN